MLLFRTSSLLLEAGGLQTSCACFFCLKVDFNSCGKVSRKMAGLTGVSWESKYLTNYVPMPTSPRFHVLFFESSWLKGLSISYYIFIVFDLIYIYIYYFLLFGLSTIGGVLNLSGQSRGWDHQQNLSCGMSGFSVILSPWLTKRRRWPFSVFPGVFLWIIPGGFNIPTMVR